MSDNSALSCRFSPACRDDFGQPRKRFADGRCQTEGQKEEHDNDEAPCFEFIHSLYQTPEIFKIQACSFLLLSGVGKKKPPAVRAARGFRLFFLYGAVIPRGVPRRFCGLCCRGDTRGPERSGPRRGAGARTGGPCVPLPERRPPGAGTPR